ncbi:hypothetical protein AM571_CH02299 [Rhizobium etli 8C-3]|uniref:SpoVG family protein n=1 Tax=Rhizobium etli 8C-3 TaxID=538025 RepID=A0A1L5P4P9_RHIET|nr:hypothetical protein [Rhizobium etli]MDW9682478.1 hypothetical protein [Sinorhizobium meliloti]APO75108.1 hypothetical protein AM571_CH02299 [Rhizobium etli 8C-3]MDW9694988.1 hypothetical protein [Sinorhizobium meliloti]MDW9719803.1 hypothetical protein [Sinorhizobium meliloti]MDW9757057.1 hypothetical protein [Sinorhizobium meliloti]
MEIHNLRPAAGRNERAIFDVQIGPHLRLYSLTLKEGPDGRLRTFAPKAFGKHAASFHPELAQQITNAAVAAMNGGAASDRSAA